MANILKSRFLVGSNSNVEAPSNGDLTEEGAVKLESGVDVATVEETGGDSSAHAAMSSSSAVAIDDVSSTDKSGSNLTEEDTPMTMASETDAAAPVTEEPALRSSLLLESGEIPPHAVVKEIKESGELSVSIGSDLAHSSAQSKSIAAQEIRASSSLLTSSLGGSEDAQTAVLTSSALFKPGRSRHLAASGNLTASSVPAPRPSVEEADAKEEEEEQDRYCVCRQGDFGVQMIACDGGCEEWFHIQCIGISEERAAAIESYVCHSCLMKRQPVERTRPPFSAAASKKSSSKRSLSFALGADGEEASGTTLGRPAIEVPDTRTSELQCFSRKCHKRARPHSRFCSDACGARVASHLLRAEHDELQFRRDEKKRRISERRERLLARVGNEVRRKKEQILSSARQAMAKQLRSDVAILSHLVESYETPQHAPADSVRFPCLQIADKASVAVQLVVSAAKDAGELVPVHKKLATSSSGPLTAPIASASGALTTAASRKASCSLAYRASLALHRELKDSNALSLDVNEKCSMSEAELQEAVSQLLQSAVPAFQEEYSSLGKPPLFQGSLGESATKNLTLNAPRISRVQQIARTLFTLHEIAHSRSALNVQWACLQRRQSWLTAFVEACLAAPVKRLAGASADASSEPAADDALLAVESVDCITCAEPVSIKQVARHLESCSRRKTAPLWSPEPGDGLVSPFCDAFDQKKLLYCKWLRGSCPFHIPPKITGSSLQGGEQAVDSASSAEVKLGPLKSDGVAVVLEPQADQVCGYPFVLHELEEQCLSTAPSSARQSAIASIAKCMGHENEISFKDDSLCPNELSRRLAQQGLASSARCARPAKDCQRHRAWLDMHRKRLLSDEESLLIGIRDWDYRAQCQQEYFFHLLLPLVSAKKI